MTNIPDNSVFFVDSTPTDFLTIEKLNPFEISNISIVKSEKNLSLNQENECSIYITTVSFAKRHYWSFFREKSKQYKDIVLTPNGDSVIKYILNGKLLSDTSAGSLFLINNLVLKKIKVISKEKLIRRYHETNKNYGVIVKTKRVKGLVKVK